MPNVLFVIYDENSGVGHACPSMGALAGYHRGFLGAIPTNVVGTLRKTHLVRWFGKPVGFQHVGGIVRNLRFLDTRWGTVSLGKTW